MPRASAPSATASVRTPPPLPPPALLGAAAGFAARGRPCPAVALRELPTLLPAVQALQAAQGLLVPAAAL